MWVKIDDGFAMHPKVLAISDAALRSYVASLCHCARYLTDGHVSDGYVQTIATPDVRAELIATGLWEESSGGIDVHDYLDFNPSSADVESERRRKSEAGKLGASSRWGNRKGRSNEPSTAGAMAGAIADAMTEGTGSSDGSSTSLSSSSEDDDVDLDDELEQLIRPLGYLSASQLREASKAWLENTAGVREVARAAAKSARPAALFTSELRAGAHRRDHTASSRREACPDCEIGGGYHAADCPRAAKAAA